MMIADVFQQGVNEGKYHPPMSFLAILEMRAITIDLAFPPSHNTLAFPIDFWYLIRLALIPLLHTLLLRIARQFIRPSPEHTQAARPTPEVVLGVVLRHVTSQSTSDTYHACCMCAQ